MRHRDNNRFVGQRFGKLLVIAYSHFKEIEVFDNAHLCICYRKIHYLKCRCDCGVEKAILESSLISGTAKSCGCLHIKHRMSDHYLGFCWRSIKGKCYNENNKQYKDYGERG